MIDEIDFLPAHLEMMDIQDAQLMDECPDVGGVAKTLLNGHVLACYGAVKVWEGRWVAWAVLSRYAAPQMLTVTRHIKEIMKHADGRLEIIVESDFKEGMRWAKMLGYSMEAERMKSFRDGKDYSLFARIS